MTAPQTSSRLQLLQARFQQRQLQEKEQKLLQLYDQQQQRAHQIALRGSTGSNDPDISNYESFISNSGKARQIFDEKRQTKGIDKSYPLEPLDKRAHKPATDTRTSIGTRRTSRNEQQRDNLSGRGIYRESVLRDSCGANRTEDSVDRGNDNEINIKEVIDSESAQRNRIPSKFGPLDLERRSQLDRLPGDASPEKMPVRRTSQAERLKNASSRKETKKPAIPTGANLGQSTYMKTTKSASLKMKKLSRNMKSVEDRKSRLHTSNKGIKKLKKQSHQSISLNDLKSTPLICQVIRNKKILRPSDSNNLGKVKTIITKIENITTSNVSKNNLSKIANNAELPKAIAAISFEPKNENKTDKFILSLSTKRYSIIDPDDCKISALKAVIASPSKNVDGHAKNNEGMNEKDGRKTLSIDRPKEPSIEYPTDHQKITIADETIKLGQREVGRRRGSSDSCINRPRRLSFELKRMIFEEPAGREPLIPRRDSVESALQHFDSISATESSRDHPIEATSVAKPEGLQLDAKDSLDKDSQLKGSVWHTRSSLTKDCNERVSERFQKYSRKALKAAPTDTKVALARKNVPAAMRRKTSVKLLEARDSIDSPRRAMKTKSPIFRMEIAYDSEVKTPEVDDDEGSAAKHFSSDSITKRTDTSGRIADSRANREKEPSPYPFSRSPENTYEQRSRPPIKSISLKFLNQIVAGEASTAEDCELGFRETSAPSIDALYVQPKDEKGAASTPQAAKQPTKPLATNASMGSSRGQIPTNACNLNLKAKSNLTIPTPVQKSNALKNITNADDSLVRCNVCNRRFSMERINFHQDICSKAVQKKRKQFDTVTQRAKGTEFESFLKKPLGKKQIKSGSCVQPEPHIVKSNWRRKHEDFINAIRSAKQMQVHLASGGKLSDLAISPPSDNSDYVKCPHCSRSFSQTVGSRHIPKCNSMQSNKRGLRNTFKAKH